MTMLLHCGAAQVDWQAVQAVKTPEPTRTWMPVSHVDFINGVKHSVETAGGLTITDQAHALARDGGSYFGTIEVANGSETEGYSMIIGLRNSHHKEFPAGISCGSRVFVCDNLSFSGEVVIKRRHTRYLRRDLPGLLQQAVGRLGALKVDMDTRITRYRQTDLGYGYADHLIIEMLRARVITSTRIPKVLAEWEHPSHEEFEEGGPTIWRLFNATTEALKGTFPQPRRTQALHGLMDQACGGITLQGDYTEIH